MAFGLFGKREMPLGAMEGRRALACSLAISGEHLRLHIRKLVMKAAGSRIFFCPGPGLLAPWLLSSLKGWR